MTPWRRPPASQHRRSMTLNNSYHGTARRRTWRKRLLLISRRPTRCSRARSSSRKWRRGATG
ncbi:unnamed protein product [Ectocarpus fasciculatus]